MSSIRLRFDAEDPQLASVAWSRLVEPGDVVAGALVNALGPGEALRWLLERGQPGLASHQALPLAAKVLARAAAGWETRLGDLDPAQDLRTITRLDGQVVYRADPAWPPALSDLGAAAPFVLWLRGDAAALRAPSVAVVGSRASTSYGELVASELAAGLVEREFAVVSGGAYGIDAAAHRGALAAATADAGPSTIAVMAGGLDRLYPLGNSALLEAVAARGAVFAEVPPGVAPFRQRFLARNRLIAALSRATVVVEAAWRSGALSTANHAAELLRPVGAVPGPVTSMASGGCHQLIRDGLAVCVTDAAEVAELAGSISAMPGANTAADCASTNGDPLAGLVTAQLAVCDALPKRATATAQSLTSKAGQPLSVVLSALGVLEARGLAAQSEETGKWRRT